jgi:hypothetical protein
LGPPIGPDRDENSTNIRTASKLASEPNVRIHADRFVQIPPLESFSRFVIEPEENQPDANETIRSSDIVCRT